MEQITARTLRQAEWRAVYQYDGSSLSFITYACDALPGLTVTHEKRGRKTRTYYTMKGRKATDSPTQAVRLYNAEAKARRKSGGPNPPSGPQPA